MTTFDSSNHCTAVPARNTHSPDFRPPQDQGQHSITSATGRPYGQTVVQHGDFMLPLDLCSDRLYEPTMMSKVTSFQF